MRTETGALLAFEVEDIHARWRSGSRRSLCDRAVVWICRRPIVVTAMMCLGVFLTGIGANHSPVLSARPPEATIASACFY